MKTVHLNLLSLKVFIDSLKKEFNGIVKTLNGEIIIKINSDLGKGEISIFQLENHITFMDFDFVLNQDTQIVFKNSNRDRVNFIYSSKGNIRHSFGSNQKPRDIDAFQTSIIANIVSDTNTIFVKKDCQIQSTFISVEIETHIDSLQSIKHSINEIFLKNKTEDYFYLGSYNFKILDVLLKMKSTEQDGIIKMLLLKGYVNIILGLEIEQHSYEMSNQYLLSTSLTQSDLEIIKDLSQYIKKSLESNLQIDDLQKKSGLSAAKLQQGFQLMYGFTVCEYIRHLRLTKAEELLSRTDLNISEVVYSVGFTSRSYFSKIFKAKFKCSPKTYKNSRMLAISA